jgi:alpha-tubulin suppressor-like RCC1 family protein
MLPSRCIRAIISAVLVATFLPGCDGDEGLEPLSRAARVSFTVQPTQTEGNQSITPTVQVAIRDEDGTTVTTAGDAVTVAIGTNPGEATLSGTATVNAVDGVATFADLSIDRPGSGYTLVASSGTLSGATSTAFDIVLTFASLNAGWGYTCGVTTSGHAYCWGSNGNGRLGDGTGTDRRTPVLVSGGLGFDSVSGGQIHTCGITQAADAYCWGHNGWGQLGNGTTSSALTPGLVVGTLDFVSVSASIRQHSCGIAIGGDGYCWGRNDAGELGDGTVSNRTSPAPVIGGLSFASLSTGDGYTCGVAAGGDGYCWGSNISSRLGGAGRDTVAPALISGGLEFAGLSTGTQHGCGVTTGGDAYCWGANSFGRLGIGEFGGVRFSPTAVLGGLESVSVSAGGTHTCVVTTGGEVHCWGRNNAGQLGDATNTDSNVPVAVSGSLSFVVVSAGNDHTCALTADGDAYCWGNNSAGQLGDGTTTASNTPVRVVQ